MSRSKVPLVSPETEREIAREQANEERKQSRREADLQDQRVEKLAAAYPNQPIPHIMLGLTEEFENWARRALKIQAAKKELEAKEKECRERLAAYLGSVRANNVEVGAQIQLQVQRRTTKTLNPVKLIERGVPSTLIAECTDEKMGEPFVVVRDMTKERAPRGQGQAAEAHKAPPRPQPVADDVADQL